MTETALQGQVNKSAAEVYEEFFVPALFGQWATRVADAAALGPGDSVIDVACGTGVLAREAERRVGPDGSVTGLDANDGMLETARRMAPGITWQQGPAESLPFADDEFDVAVSQFGLMFFADRAAALREMRRVTKPGGRIVVAVCGPLEDAPGYADLVALLERLFGQATADELRAPFVLGDIQRFRAVLTQGGLSNADIQTPVGEARFDSIEAWMHTDVKGWTLADMIDDAQYARLLREAEQALDRYVQPDGSVRFAFPAHIAVAREA